MDITTILLSLVNYFLLLYLHVPEFQCLLLYRSVTAKIRFISLDLLGLGYPN